MMNKVVFFLVSVVVSLPATALETAELETSERFSYAMGVRLGQLLKVQGIQQLDSHAFAQAIDDVMKDRPLRLSQQEMMAAIQEHQGAVVQQKEQRAQANLETGRAFLAENAGKPGIKVLPSGVQYLVLESGTGKPAQDGGRVRVHYHGTLLDGTVFDSSVERKEPVEFSLANVIPGFRDSIAQMHVGDRWQVFIPSDQAYGKEGAGTKIGPNETLIFEIQLLDVTQ